MVCLRDRYICIIFFCVGGIALCLLTLLLYKAPQRFVLNLDPRVASQLKAPIIDAYYKHQQAMPQFLNEIQSLLPSINTIERYIKPHGTYVKITVNTPQALLIPSNTIVCKSKQLIAGQLVTEEQRHLLESVEVLESITPKNESYIVDFILNKAPLLTPYFALTWHNKTCIALTPHEYVNKHRYTLIINHTQNINTVLTNYWQQFINFHAEQKKNQKTNHWIVDLRFDDWWIIHTRGLEGVCP